MNLKKNVATILLLCTVTLGLALNGCSSGGSSGSATAPNQSTVYGVAALGTTTPGTVSAKDSSVPAQEKTAAISSNGSFTMDVNGLNPPYVLKAVSTDNTGTTIQMYSVSMTGGRTNINAITDVAVTAAANGTNPDTLYAMPDRDMYRRTSDDFESIISKLQTVLAPLFALYQVSGSPVTDDDHEYGDDDNSGLSALLHDVRFIVDDGRVVVKNRATGAIIFSGRLNDLNSGTFNPANMPAGPGGSTGSTTCTSFTYSGWGTCQSNGTQTQTVVTSSPAGCTGGTPLISQSCTYVPPACTYNYSAWGACQSNGTQTRTAVSSPAGCTGTPAALSQACTYVPPVTACTSFTYSVWGACQSNNTQTRTIATSLPSGCTGGTPVLSQSCTYVPPVTACTSFTYSAWGACQSNNTQTRTVATSSPTGCTGGTPSLSQACTYVPPVTACTSFTYSAWGACQSNSTQTRTVATSSPTGCTGGTPALSQACTYVPPVTACTSFTYSAWGTCQSNNTQTRTVATSSPTGCTGGSPVLSQSCTYVPPTPVCGSCHAIPPASGQHDFHVNSQGYQCSTCHGAGYTSTAVTATTHQNGVVNTVASINFNATASSCSPGCHGTRTW